MEVATIRIAASLFATTPIWRRSGSSTSWRPDAMKRHSYDVDPARELAPWSLSPAQADGSAVATSASGYHLGP